MGGMSCGCLQPTVFASHLAFPRASIDWRSDARDEIVRVLLNRRGGEQRVQRELLKCMRIRFPPSLAQRSVARLWRGLSGDSDAVLTHAAPGHTDDTDRFCGAASVSPAPLMLDRYLTLWISWRWRPAWRSATSCPAQDFVNKFRSGDRTPDAIGLC